MLEPEYRAFRPVLFLYPYAIMDILTLSNKMRQTLLPTAYCLKF